MKLIYTLLLLPVFSTQANPPIIVGVTNSNFDASSMCGCKYTMKGQKGFVFIPELKNRKYRASMNINSSEIVLEKNGSTVSKCEKPYDNQYCRSETYANSKYQVDIKQLKSKSLCGTDRECEASEKISSFTIKTSTESITFIGIGTCAC